MGSIFTATLSSVEIFTAATKFNLLDSNSQDNDAERGYLLWSTTGDSAPSCDLEACLVGATHRFHYFSVFIQEMVSRQIEMAHRTSPLGYCNPTLAIKAGKPICDGAGSLVAVEEGTSVSVVTVQLSLVVRVHIHYSGLVDLIVQASVSNCADGYTVPPLCMTYCFHAGGKWADFFNSMDTAMDCQCINCSKVVLCLPTLPRFLQYPCTFLMLARMQFFQCFIASFSLCMIAKLSQWARWQ